jgi:hypothetical protein
MSNIFIEKLKDFLKECNLGNDDLNNEEIEKMVENYNHCCNTKVKKDVIISAFRNDEEETESESDTNEELAEVLENKK